MAFKIIFVIGSTNAGKTRFLNGMQSGFPDVVGLVQVGKIMRAKYPPDYFKGQGAPLHTQEEAITIMTSGLGECRRNKVDIALVDGQPRDTKQLHYIREMYAKEAFFLHLWAPQKVLLQRAAERDGDSLQAFDLSYQRLKTDAQNVFPIASELHATVPSRYRTFNTAVACPIEHFSKELKEGTFPCI